MKTNNQITKNELLQCYEYDKKYNHGQYTKMYIQQVMDQYMALRNTDTSSLPTDQLGDLKIPARIRHALMRHGITTQDHLCTYTEKALQVVPGIGKEAVIKIEEALSQIGKTLSK